MFDKFLIVVILVVAFVLMGLFGQKRDYSHVDPKYRNLVHFAEGAGY